MNLGSVTLTILQSVVVTFNPKNAALDPIPVTLAALPGFDPSLLDVTIATDNKSATIRSKGVPGGPTTVTFQGTNNADATLVADQATVAVTVVALDATLLGAALGTPV